MTLGEKKTEADTLGLLQNIRVLEFGYFGAGPLCPRQLATLGAQVIKLELLQGDPSRQYAPLLTVDGGYVFHFFNAGKLSLALDLKSPQARPVVESLVSQCDVVVESFSPGVVDRLGFGYAALSALNPKLIYCSVSGFGQTGPLASKRALDTVVQAMAGAMSITGWPHRPPTKLGVSVADGAAGAAAAAAVLAALWRRVRTGEGARIDISMQDVLVWCTQPRWEQALQAGSETPSRHGNRHPQRCPDNVYQTSDGWVAISVETPAQWRSLTVGMGAMELAQAAEFATNTDRLAHSAAVDGLISAWTSRQSTDATVAACLGQGVPAAPTLDAQAAVAHPHTVSRGTVSRVSFDSGLTAGVVNSPFRLSSTPSKLGGRGPYIGEHTEWILTQLLGYSAQAVRDLERSGVVRIGGKHATA